DQERIAGLVRALGSERFAQREEASTRLLEVGSVALPFLRESLKSSDPEVQRRSEECIQALQSRTTPMMIEAAIRLLA
uniref:hypothetical protein n=1 Tax=Escherichia coli TaxID=562 RepID=UPI00235EF6FF